MDKQIVLSLSVTLAAIADITARKQAEVDRRRYDHELKSIFNALSDFYFRLVPDGTVLSYGNPTSMAELRAPPEQFFGRRMIDFYCRSRQCCLTPKSKNNYVDLEGNDNGNSIPPNVQKYIFDPLFTTKEIGNGSGFGLSMMQSVVIKNNAHLLTDVTHCPRKARKARKYQQ